MTERVEKAVEVREWRTVVALTEASGAAGNAARVAQQSYERIKRSAENAERQARQRARRKVAGWAAGVLADPNAVVLSLATAGSGERVDVVEVALLDTEGRTLLHERVRADRGPAGGVGVAADEVRIRLRKAFAPTGEGQAPAGSGRRVVVFDGPSAFRLLVHHAPEVFRILSQGTGRDGSGEGDATGIEDARTHYYRAYGEWNIETEDYCLCTFFPGKDGTALGDARATLALVKKLADEHGASAPGGPGLGCLCAPEGCLDAGLCPICEEGTPAEELVFSGDTLVCQRCAEDVEGF